MCTYFGHKAFHGCWILKHYNILRMDYYRTIFLVTWGVMMVAAASVTNIALGEVIAAPTTQVALPAVNVNIYFPLTCLQMLFTTIALN